MIPCKLFPMTWVRWFCATDMAGCIVAFFISELVSSSTTVKTEATPLAKQNQTDAPRPDKDATIVDLTVSDSDDDEPLAKRTKNKSSEAICTKAVAPNTYSGTSRGRSSS